jgi:peptidoglycan/LPS O-acetylase OafA/YrhL
MTEGAGDDGRYLGHVDSYRVIACTAVIVQHSLLWIVPAGLIVPWAFVMLLHFSRTAFFFMTAFLLAYSQRTRPRSTGSFWKRRFIQLGVPYLIWTGIYWVFTLWQEHWPMGAAYSDLWRDLLYGYYQLYFCIVLFQLYLVFPFVYRWLVARQHHLRIMTISLVVALVLATILHWPGAFGPVGHAAFWLAPKWPWARDILTYQEQVIAGILVALHVEKLPAFIERWGRWVVAGGAALLVVATMWYLIAVWTGSQTGRASDLYQPVAFLWFTGAVAALECWSWRWYARTSRLARSRKWLSATNLSNLTGGIFFCQAIFLNLFRSALDSTGLRQDLGWAGSVAVLFVLTIVATALFALVVQRTRLAWLLTGPVRPEQRRRLGISAIGAEGDEPPVAALAQV